MTGEELTHLRVQVAQHTLLALPTLPVPDRLLCVRMRPYGNLYAQLSARLTA